MSIRYALDVGDSRQLASTQGPQLVGARELNAARVAHAGQPSIVAIKHSPGPDVRSLSVSAMSLRLRMFLLLTIKAPFLAQLCKLSIQALLTAMNTMI